MRTIPPIQGIDIADHTGKTINIETGGRVLTTTGGIAMRQEGDTEITAPLTTAKVNGKEKMGGTEGIERIVTIGTEASTMTKVGGGHIAANTDGEDTTTITMKNRVTTDGDSRTDEMTDRTTTNTDIENDIPLLLSMHP